MKKGKKIVPVQPTQETPKATVSGFEVVKKGKLLTYLSVKGRVVVLNHHSKSLICSKGEVSAPPQELLKEIYDSSSSNAQLIKAPNGYEAPWSKFQ